MVEKDEFIEHCLVHDNMYGTAVKEIRRIQESNRIPLLDIDTQGAEKIHLKGIDANFVFVKPCEDLSKANEVCRKRLVGRKTESDELIEVRLKNGLKEIEMYQNADYYNYSVVNEDLETAKAEFKKLFEDAYPEEIENFKNAA